MWRDAGVASVMVKRHIAVLLQAFHRLHVFQQGSCGDRAGEVFY